MVYHHKDTSQIDDQATQFGNKTGNPSLSQSQKVATSRNLSKNIYRGLGSLSQSLLCYVICFAVLMEQNVCQAFATEFYLDGIGYREQALQQAKGTNFASEDAEGIAYASFAGGTHIFIKGSGLTDNPQSNFVFLYSHDFEQDIMAPLLTEDDAFNSHPFLGNIAYRLPALDELIGVPMTYLSGYQSMTFTLSVESHDELGTETLACKTTNYCKITYYRAYTPVLYYIAPPIVYYESQVDVFFDPRSTTNLISDLEQDEMHFINAKIGESLLDFEFMVDFDDSYSQYYRNRVRGVVGELPAGELYNISMLWETGNSNVIKQEATHCTFDNQTCFQARSVPVIFDLSSNVGYSTGGMNLTVTGYGFNNENITATVDGVNCTITSYSDTSFSCDVNAGSVSDLTVSHVGSHGIRRDFYNHTTWMSWESLGQYADIKEEQLMLAVENPYKEGDKMTSLFKGWFIPPKTTAYRFYQACDDYCSFNLGNVSGQVEDSIELMRSTSYSDYRDWYENRHSHTVISEWVNLTEGEPYYLQARTYEGSGGDHFAVAVEIEQDEMVGHHHSIKEVQKVWMESAQVFEVTRFTITDPDDGEYILIFQNPSDLSYVSTDPIAADATASQFKNAVKGYYSDYFSSGCTVNLTMYDFNGTETTNTTNATSYVYMVTLTRLINDYSASGITVVKTTTKATVTFDLPVDVQLSAVPLSGKFRIKCVSPIGSVSYSEDLNLNWHSNPNWVNEKMNQGCDMFYDTTEVSKGEMYDYKVNGQSFLIRFLGMNDDPGQFELADSESNPLTGTNITFNGTTEVAYGTNLFYEPIPLEFIRTYEEKPQLIVSVNDVPAVCHNLTCDFTYIEPVGMIDEYTYDHSSRILVLTGTDLPNTTANISSINFAHTHCTIDWDASAAVEDLGECSNNDTSVDDNGLNCTAYDTDASLCGLNDTSTFNSTTDCCACSGGTYNATYSQTLTCTLDEDPTCGDHFPILYSNIGIIPLNETLPAETITCTLTSIWPSSSLNLLGGDNLTFTGSMLPKQLSTSSVSIKFDDAQETECVPQISSTDQLVCLTDAFDKDLSKNADLGFQVIINGQTVSQSISTTTRDVIQAGDNLSPPSVSPVLKSNVTIQLPLDFPYTLAKEDFSVNATNITNPDYIRYMNVIDVDDDAKTITTKFGGAESGQYRVMVRHSATGIIESDGLTLDVNAYVTSYSPMKGSIYGGTLLTINGQNFGDEYTDNPVQISTNGGVDSIDCYVQTTNSSMITCRVDDEIVPRDAGKEGEMVVFLKTSEEATCDPDVRAWVYTYQIPILENITTTFDNSSLQWVVSVTGTDFETSTDGVELQFSGIAQTTTSISDTEVVFAITDAPSQTLSSNKLYFAVGTPENHTVVEASIEITPQLASISPNVGSVGGTIITATVPGATTSSTGIDIVDDSNNSICETVTVTSYGVVECKTLAQVINASTQLSVTQDGIYYPCMNSDITQCQYEQLDDGSFPNVTSAAITDENTIVFTGTAFEFSSDYSPLAEFNGISADSVTVDDATQATATFVLGVPLTTEETTPILSFLKNDNSTQVFAVSQVDLTNEISITDSTSGLTCSFAGGCQYEVTANGLATMFKNDSSSNYISICDEICEFNEEDSTSSVTKCKLPQISTIYSNENFAIATESEDLDSGEYFGTADDSSVAFDGNVLITPEDSSSGCSLGMSFKKDHVGMISQVKYFMGAMDSNDKAELVDITDFQGSNDNVTFTTLFTIDDNLHSGWNYHKWDSPDDYPKYRFYRFYGASSGACAINEITFTGVETIDNSDSSYTCEAKIVIDEEETSLNSVEYQGSLTANLQAISPRHGTVVGGDVVTFTGENFVTDTSLYTITIDGFDCAVSAATSTSVTCTTGKRPGLVESSLEIYIEGRGLVSNNDLLFYYCSFWSSDTTWGGEFAPMDGESIYVPAGLNLYVDIDSSPHLNAVIVEGSIIFAPDSDPNHERFFDANYLFISGGLMEVGTEEFPYTSKITITMHSSIDDPYLPIYGNKVIGVRYGTLDMHGIERTPTWTSLESTVEAGGSVITLMEEVDWQPGEMIAVASTSYEPREGEHRTILSIDSTRKIITVDQPFDYKHFAEVQTFGTDGDFIEMRAEVGLLSRNVVYRGDPETSPGTQYGATIFLHSNGDDSLTCRLSYIELTNVGQAFKVGRYAVHFHMIGAVHNSYAKGLGTHQGNNRAFTLHGTHYLRIEDNVAYEVKGHTVFIEDAVETNNYIKNNLIMKTKRSWSLLNTDQTPACFWITHPNNIFIDNHAAGSDRYGFWYDLQTNAIGPSANIDVCPENDRVGEFTGNQAHSMGRYGLRIFHNMVPRTYPCKGLTYDSTNPDEPYWQNPPITANFDNFVGWKNNRNGAIAERVGDVRFNNFKTADNLLAGIEYSLTGELKGDYASINTALIIGRTNNTELYLDVSSPHGIITARTENFVIRDVKFYNFDFNDAAALGTCSHCFHDAATDQGARTITTSGLWFDEDTMPRRIRYQTPFKAIFYDLDGSLTGVGANSWATFDKRSHNIWDACTVSEEIHNGVVCDNSVQIRSIRFHSYSPSGLFDGMALKVLPYDDDIINAFNETELEEYIDDRSNYGSFNWKFKNGKDWATPFVTGHKYKISWGLTGIDFETMKFTISEKYLETDHSVYFVHNFTDVRQAIYFTTGGETFENETIPDSWDDFTTGQNLVLNDTETRELHFVVNGKSKTHPLAEQTVEMEGVRCVGSCVEAIVEVETEIGVRYWSDVSNWPNETLPVEGDDVHIESGWNMILDIEETPVFELIRINGVLTFSNETDIHLRAKHIFIRAGELHIGNETHPYNRTARITLHGEKNAEAMVYENAIEAGNKLIANVGLLKMYGKPRTGTLTRLHAECFMDATEIYVESGLDWVAGDRIALGPTSFAHDRSEDNFVTAYDIETGKVTLETPLKYHHWGKSVSTGDDYNGVDMRGEVILLSRNIIIAGEDIESWGGQIVTSDAMEFIDNEITFRYGQTLMDNVEIYNCSQWDTYKAAIRFESASTLYSSITNSAIHNGLGWGANVKTSANIHFANNVWYDFRPVGIAVDYSKNITFDGNVLMRVLERTSIEADGMFEDKRGGFAICSYFESHSSCTDISIINNIATGVTFAGFIVQGDNCDAENPTGFKGNVAHSTAGTLGGFGAIIYPTDASSTQSECYEASDFSAYKNYYMGAWGFFESREVRFHHMTMIDNREGFGAMLAIPDDANQYNGALIQLNDNKIYAETEVTDCPEDGSYCKVFDKMGFQMAGFAVSGKSLMPQMSSALPMYKIKAYAPWGGMQRNYRNTFYNFVDTTAQGSHQGLVALNPYQSDYHNMVEFYDTKFVDCDGDALAYIMSPKPGWANIKDCGEFPCTAPLNVLLHFFDSEFEGSKPRWASDEFQIIANNSGFAPYIESCEPKEAMNGYVCQEESLGILLFESEDEDKFDRSMQPIYVSKQGTEMANKLNSMMDHVWDGFYSGQIRMSRFGSIIDAPRGSVYDLTFTGSPAKKLKFTLNGMSRSMGTTIRIAYPGAESRSIVKDGAIVEMNQWDDSLQQYGEIKQTSCGENRYIGVQNILEFYLTVNCTLQIQPRDAIQTLVRMEWTMAEFFADGGTTSFIDRLTGSLGIHASQVKIVSVYEGSLVVNYELEPEEGQSLDELESQQNEAFENGAVDLGAPVLEFTAAVVTSEDTSGSDYEPVTISVPDYIQDNVAVQNVFDSEGISIAVEESVQQETNVIEVESEPEDVYTYTQQTVIVDAGGPEVIHLEKEKDPYVIIVPIALSIIVVIIAAVGCRFCMSQQKKELLEAQNRAQRAKDFKINPTSNFEDVLGEKEMAELKNLQNLAVDTPYVGVERSSNVNSMRHGVEEYEAQYDPNNDFAIFGVGDQTRGGVQTMKEKMNLADGVKEADDSSSSDEDSSRVNRKDSKLSTQVQTGLHPSSRGSKGMSSNEEFRSGSAGSSNFDSNSKMIGVENVDNELPEDKEIHSDNEEE